MNTFVSSYYMENTKEYKDLHAKLMSHFGIDLQYFSDEDFPSHSKYIDGVLQLDYDMFMFFDIDCVPLSKTIVEDSETIIKRNGNCLFGNLQFTGHARCNKHNLNLGRNHNYCAPSFLCITKTLFESIGRPSAKGIRKSTDPAQSFSVCCDKLGLNRIMLLPSKVLRPKWSNDSHTTGIGTYYEFQSGKISINTYHHFEARKKNIDEFQNVIKGIINDRR